MTKATSNKIINDSGTSEHAVGDIQLMTDVRSLPNILVELPDIQRVAAAQRGSSFGSDPTMSH